jgi:hypothetical protein
MHHLIFHIYFLIARAKKIVASSATPQQASPERQVRSRAGVSQSQRKFTLIKCTINIFVLKTIHQ